MTGGFELPESISIDGVEYAVNTDFRAWIEIGRIFADKADDMQKRLERILILAYRSKLPPTAEAAVNGVLDFYRAGESTNTDSGELPILDLYTDFSMIAAAFMRDYSVDLWETNMHWWKFRALFSCLSDDNRIIKVMGYRAVNIADITDKKQKKFYKKMKTLYSLEDWRSDEEKELYMVKKLSSVFEEV